MLLLYHLGRESWRSIRHHPASLAPHCCLGAEHPPLCTRSSWPALPGWARLSQPHSSFQIARSYKAWGCLQVCTCTQITRFRCTCALTCTYTLQLASKKIQGEDFFFVSGSVFNKIKLLCTVHRQKIKTIAKRGNTGNIDRSCRPSVIIRQFQVFNYILLSLSQLYQSRGGQRLRSLGSLFVSFLFIIIWNIDKTYLNFTLSHIRNLAGIEWFTCTHARVERHF